ncbi:unnamed protein product [Notodromas monacha]|uniref:Rhodanese domain-containing protein n=1 Tax=Notodromas monacha TaxID=399045 RepID=A0A7R9G993_9CRUS|nr:unnamed protein product [Notodromas monacha]CAG0914002.1 unnamed protein product [Notodromas monacha]
MDEILRWYKGGFLDWMQHNGTSVLTSTDSPTELEEVISSEAASADLTTDPVEGEGALENSSDSSTAVEENETPPSAAAAKDLTEFIIHDFESAFQSFSPPEFSEKYGCERPEKPGSNIVIYSNNRTSAQDAMAELHRFGYNEAIMYDGGLADWTTNGGSLQLSGSTEEKEPEVPVITSEDLKKGLDADALTLIDVRNETEIVADGKVPKSHNVPLPEIFEAFKLPEEEFVAKYGFKRPPPPGDDVVIMCRSGRRALNAIVLLRSLGYTNLIGSKCSGIFKKFNFKFKNSGNCPKKKKTVQGLGYEEFKKIYNERSSVVIDIRPAEEFYLDGIQDTVSLPAGEIEAASALSDEEFAAKYGFFKPQADWSDALILGVNGCDVLGTVHDIMKSGGIKVRWYIGGIEEWNERNPMTTDSSGITPNVIPDPQKA